MKRCLLVHRTSRSDVGRHFGGFDVILEKMLTWLIHDLDGSGILADDEIDELLF